MHRSRALLYFYLNPRADLHLCAKPVTVHEEKNRVDKFASKLTENSRSARKELKTSMLKVCLTYTPPLNDYLLQGLHSKACKKIDWCFTCEFKALVLKLKNGNSPLSEMLVSMIDRPPCTHKGKFFVKPARDVHVVAPSAYYAEGHSPSHIYL
ncbi:hypothetical protein Tco_1266809 [Tanacetum coccineum]